MACPNVCLFFNNKKFILSQLQRPDVYNLSVSRAELSLESLGGGSFPCLFQFLVARGIPWLEATWQQPLPLSSRASSQGLLP